MKVANNMKLNVIKQALDVYLARGDWSDEFLQDAYEIVSDLWVENEADGCHNADGTFKRQ